MNTGKIILKIENKSNDSKVAFILKKDNENNKDIIITSNIYDITYEQILNSLSVEVGRVEYIDMIEINLIEGSPHILYPKISLEQRIPRPLHVKYMDENKKIEYSNMEVCDIRLEPLYFTRKTEYKSECSKIILVNGNTTFNIEIPALTSILFTLNCIKII